MTDLIHTTTAQCNVCFRHCRLQEGRTGACSARICRDGVIECANYGYVTSLALDPIEKKPLRRFHPGSVILSVGSYGCNLRCPYCQNYEISLAGEDTQTLRQETAYWREHARQISPEELRDIASYYRHQGNIGAAYTYNEALVGWEYVRDCARLIHEAGMSNVLVTNGTAELWVLSELSPYIDAMNIDLKSFSEEYYSKVLGGNLTQVKDFISQAVTTAHVEITTLCIPGDNDSEEEIEAIASWIAALPHVNEAQGSGRNIPLHISRFFPRHYMQDRAPTDPAWIYHLADVARRHLRYVYTGNC